MSVVLFREIWPGRQSEFVYSYIPADTTDRVFMVRTNNRGDDATVITAYTGPIVSPYGELAHPARLHPPQQRAAVHPAGSSASAR